MLAHLVLELESKMIGEAGSEMKMVYLNAVPRDKYGYNEMTSVEERVRVFNGLLEKAEDRFQPEKIFVACGSLSALLDEVPYLEKHRHKIQGIGWVGRQLLKKSIQEKPDSGGRRTRCLTRTRFLITGRRPTGAAPLALSLG